MTGNGSMPRTNPNQDSLAPAVLFAALGDGTRLEIVERLAREGQHSISALAEEATISRQAVTKHLHVLEKAGLTASRREGRECIIELRPGRLAAIHDYLDRIDREWDKAIIRLQTHVHQKGVE